VWTVSPAKQERYACRLLLLNKVGPKSFDDLRTVNNVKYDTYAEAAKKMGLLQSDDQWKNV
jgi:hypothetical protein